MEMLSWILIVIGVAILLILFLLNISTGDSHRRKKNSYIEDIRDKSGQRISSVQVDIAAGQLADDQHPVSNEPIEVVKTRPVDQQSKAEADQVAAQQRKDADKTTEKSQNQQDIFAEDWSEQLLDDEAASQKRAKQTLKPDAEMIPSQPSEGSQQGDQDNQKTVSKSKTRVETELSQPTASDHVADDVRHSIDEQQVSLFIAARQKNGIPGGQLLQALESSGLQFGDMNIYHRFVQNEHDEICLFSVANGVKPWTLNPEDIRQQSTPGISLVMQLPTVIDNVESMEFFLASARILADELGADLLNASHQPISEQDRQALLRLADQYRITA